MRREQLLAAHHLIMGTTNILTVSLPEGWRLTDGHAAPEVDRWTEYRGCRWMSQGRAPYRLVEPHPGQPGLVRAEVELLVTAAPLERAAGHNAAVTHTTVKRGLLRQREVPSALLTLECPQTGRRLMLELVAGLRGGAPTAAAEDLDRLLNAMAAGLSCH